MADPVNGFDIIGNGLDENNLGLGAKIGLPLGPNWELGLGYDALIGDDAVTTRATPTSRSGFSKYVTGRETPRG